MNINKTDLQKLNTSYIPFCTALFITALIALLNIPIMETLWRYSFDDGTYSHAYLIPFIVGYLFYISATDNNMVLRKKLNLSALLIFVLSGYILFVASTAQVSLFYWLATLLLLCTAINLVFKSNIKIFFPALYFIFLIPVWGVLVVPLQTMSIIAVNMIMGLTSIPVFVEQEFVQIPSGVFEIAGGCSGLRYLITSLAISSLFSFLYFKTNRSTIIFVFIAILGALLTNWLRISALIIIGHQTEMTSSLMEDHNMFGWYLYIPFMFLLFKFGGYLSAKEDNTSKVINKPSEKSKINWTIITILFAGLLLSSTSFTMSSINKSKDLLVNVKIKPLIQNYSSVNIISNNPKTVDLIYNFDGGNLESKPTFFENNLIPQHWTVINKVINNESQVIQIKNGLQTGTITASYEIAGLKIGSSSKFKLERLKHAITGKRKTKLHWQIQLD